MHPTTQPQLRDQAERLGLRGLLAHWGEIEREPWLARVIELEGKERGRRSLERRFRNAKIGSFKPMSEFEWDWPKKIDRAAIEQLFDLEFLKDATNVIFVGPSGVGKTMLAKNLAYQAILAGHAARFVTASQLLNELAAQESGAGLLRRLKRFARSALLVIDELGYLANTSKHADLLFEVINQRYLERSIILTTNKPFQEWNELFPNSACLVALIDRLMHRAELLAIDGESYRVKEARERARSSNDRKASQKKHARQ